SPGAAPWSGRGTGRRRWPTTTAWRPIPNRQPCGRRWRRSAAVSARCADLAESRRHDRPNGWMGGCSSANDERRSSPGRPFPPVVPLRLLDADEPVAVRVDLPELFVGAEELLARHVAVAVAVHLLEPQRPAWPRRPPIHHAPARRQHGHAPQGIWAA